MVKSAVLLLVVGLAAGLWLGFNPQAHQETLQKWDSVKSEYMKITADSNLKVQSSNTTQATSQVRTYSKSRSKSEPATATQPQTQAPSQPAISINWNQISTQISTAFETAWNSLQGFWANVVAKINTAR